LSFNEEQGGQDESTDDEEDDESTDDEEDDESTGVMQRPLHHLQELLTLH